jgi:hypothetical protein
MSQVASLIVAQLVELRDDQSRSKLVTAIYFVGIQTSVADP